MSTVFERAMMNRPDVFETFHEPRGIPYYYGPPDERGSKRYRDHPVRKTHAEVTASIAKAKAAAPPGSLVFIKDMAYYLCNNEGVVDPVLLNEVLEAVDVHTFLIRNPAKQVSSLHKMSTTQQDTVGWDEFIPAEVGYVELSLVHDALVKQGRRTVTIDADDVLSAPETTLRLYCSEAGIPFLDHMLTWEANEDRIVRKFAEWGGWHDSAISSTGWERQRTTATVVEMPTENIARNPDNRNLSIKVTEKHEGNEKANIVERTVDETSSLLNACVMEAMTYYTPLYMRRVGGTE